ncbi:hypothetical protein DL98DRAFT_172946 [Cadophora sp. DSE1049]|nr:hypothetical protein DL98DRAFT_172946 [Cadophora sp. DSE1049]
MGIYSTPQNIRPISSTYPRRQAQSYTRSQTYPGININTQPNSHPNIQGQSRTNLTLENASLHSQLIALKRELARREAQSLRERRDAEVVGAGTRLSPQFYSQVPAQNQFHTQGQFQGHGQSQYQTQTPIQSQARLFPTETDSVLCAAIEYLHASIRELADVYGRTDLDSRGSGKGSEKGRRDGGEKVRRGGDRVEVWNEIPSVLKSGVREVEMRGERERGVMMPAVLKASQTRRRSSGSSGSSGSSSEGRSRDRGRERDSRERNAYGDREQRRETGVQTLLAALLTREIYLAMWENAFFLADEPNAVRTRYKERKKASASAASGLSGGRRDSRDSKDGKGGRRDSRDSEDGRDSRDGRDRRDERRKGGGEVDAAIRMITRSTILGDTFRDLWNCK